MKIMVINPNSSKEMTASIRTVLEKIKRQDTQLTVTCPDKGPIEISSALDEIHAAYHMMDLVRQANKENYDAVIVACFSDPGLTAAREVSDILVVGIEESTMHVAATLGYRFSILTPGPRRIPSKYNDAWRNKLYYNLASVRALGMTVTETDSKPEEAQQRILEVARQAVEQDGAEVIILGCAGMVGYAEKAARELNVVVLDPTSTALKYTEALVDLGVAHSKRALYATPMEKEYR